MMRQEDHQFRVMITSYRGQQHHGTAQDPCGLLQVSCCTLTTVLPSSSWVPPHWWCPRILPRCWRSHLEPDVILASMLTRRSTHTDWPIRSRVGSILPLPTSTFTDNFYSKISAISIPILIFCTTAISYHISQSWKNVSRFLLFNINVAALSVLAMGKTLQLRPIRYWYIEKNRHLKRKYPHDTDNIDISNIAPMIHWPSSNLESPTGTTKTSFMRETSHAQRPTASTDSAREDISTVSLLPFLLRSRLSSLVLTWSQSSTTSYKDMLILLKLRFVIIL